MGVFLAKGSEDGHKAEENLDSGGSIKILAHNMRKKLWLPENSGAAGTLYDADISAVCSNANLRPGDPIEPQRLIVSLFHSINPLPLYQKALCGLTAGAIGASVGSPADLALTRMQADYTLPQAQRRNYKKAFHALMRIIADEGVLAQWKGSGPTVVRAMALNMGMLASYDQSVELFRDTISLSEASTVVGASAVSGFFAAACSLPFDYVKTQIQKMQPDVHGNYPYSGSLNCVLKDFKSWGVHSNSVLNSVASYQMSCFPIPDSILKQLDTLQRCGIVFYRANGRFVAARYWQTSAKSILEFEAHALLAAVEWAQDMHVQNITFISDNLALVNAINGDIFNIPWTLFYYVQDCKNGLTSLGSSLCKYVPRKMNEAADVLAKLARKSP
ncbi:hypothetical protein C5167_019942, partial [Papaver somniferum]